MLFSFGFKIPRSLPQGAYSANQKKEGIVAVESIGEPVTHLTYIGVTAEFEERSTLKALHDGIIRFVNLHTVKSRSGGLVT